MVAGSSDQSHRLKLDRAEVHLNELTREADAFTGTGPYLLCDAFNPATRSIEIRVRIIRQPPTTLSLLAGDCLTNLRASLDHLTYAAAVAHVGGPPAKPRDVQFPICASEAVFQAKSTQRCIAELAPSARAAIEQLQPYHGGNVSAHPLWLLAELSNADKHRLLNIVGGYLPGARHVLRQTGGPTPGVTTGGTANIGPLLDGTVVARLELPRNVTETVDGDFELFVDYVLAFEASGPVPNCPLIAALAAIRDHVRDVVGPALEPFLLSP